ncbi:hypothetical protein D3C75_865170 [compost metagenome]
MEAQQVRVAVRARDDVGVAQVSGEPGSGKRADYPAAHGASSTLFKLPLEVVLGRDIRTEARTEQPRACCPQVAELGLLQQWPAAARVVPGQLFLHLGC